MRGAEIRYDPAMPARLGLGGSGGRLEWPEGQVYAGEDEVYLGPRAAIVAAGRGAIGRQGRPASKLTVWSVLSELPRRPGAAGLEAGLLRAHEAVRRLSLGWAPGLLAPFACAAAAVLEGATLWIGHVGDCRVSRVEEGSPRALTEEHTLGRMMPEAPQEVAGVLVRALGIGAPGPVVRRVEVRAGDRFLLATAGLHRALAEREIAACLASPRAGEALRASARAGRACGAASFALIEVCQGAGGPIQARPSPPRSWLYAPGAELPAPPSELPSGPTARWFAEVWSLVMAGDDDRGGV